jgi:hypothetical protein
LKIPYFSMGYTAMLVNFGSSKWMCDGEIFWQHPPHMTELFVHLTHTRISGM